LCSSEFRVNIKDYSGSNLVIEAMLLTERFY
jgi:hypothetical protein